MSADIDLSSLISSADAAAALMGAADGAAPDLATVASEALQIAMENTDLSAMSDAQVADLESGDHARVRAALGLPANAEDDASNAFSSSPEANAEEHAAAATAAAREAGRGAVSEEGAPVRVSIKALRPEDRARTVRALDLIRGGRPPAEAFGEVFGYAAMPHAQHESAAENAWQQHEHDSPPGVDALEHELALLQHEYRAAREAQDPAAGDVLERMTDVKLDLRDARREAAAAAVENSAWMAQQGESHARAMDMYAELITDGDSNFLPYCDDEILLAEAKNDPILHAPDWPEKIGRRVLDKFFPGNAAHSPASGRARSAIPPAPRHAVRLPGSPVGAGFAAGSLSPVTAAAEIEKLTPEQQDALILSLDRLTSTHMRR